MANSDMERRRRLVPASLFACAPVLSWALAPADEWSPVPVFKDQLLETGKDRMLPVGAIKPVIAVGMAHDQSGFAHPS